MIIQMCNLSSSHPKANYSRVAADGFVKCTLGQFTHAMAFIPLNCMLSYNKQQNKSFFFKG